MLTGLKNWLDDLLLQIFFVFRSLFEMKILLSQLFNFQMVVINWPVQLRDKPKT